jgi:serine protease Do
MKIISLVTYLGIAASVFAAPAVTDSAIVQKFQSSVVRVEYTLRFDKGDYPEVAGMGQRCPKCGEVHSLGDGSELVRQERPLEVTGFVLSADRVLTTDAMIHPRFVEKIFVRFQDELIAARPIGYALGHAAVLLQLEKPLQGGKGIEFGKSGAKPFNAISYARQNGKWTFSVEKMSDVFTMPEKEQGYITGPSGSLITDANGLAVGIGMGQLLPLDNSWQQSPTNWSFLSAQDMDKKLAEFEGRVNQGILRVKMNFRSPKNLKQKYDYGSQEEETAAEINAAGVVIDPNHVLVLAKLKPKVTAMLEHILVYPVTGDAIEASFDGTLTHYGAFTAVLKQPLPSGSPVVMAVEPITDFDRKLLLSAEVKIQGENRTVYVGHNRFSSFSTGWRRQLQPSLSISAENRYLFDLQGRLIALPLSWRERILSGEDRGMEEVSLTACSYLRPALTARGDNFDAGNIPLGEQEENRIAWLGVELQSLTEELARINQVSSLTRDGETGAMVSFVYENSPASKAGVEAGDILLRFYIDGQPRPLEVQLKGPEQELGEMFPWDCLGELPEEYYDQLPTPWPGVENSFIRVLTDLGFGTKFRAEIFRGGKVIQKDFVVTQSPPHYNSAPRFKSEPLGMTVCNLTYEVRRYFRLAPEDPGVIISRLEPGSRASVAGMKPYEMIIHVNNVPVMDVSGFEKLVRDGGELKLFVKRMTKGRVVDIKMDSTQGSSNKDPNQQEANDAVKPPAGEPNEQMKEATKSEEQVMELLNPGEPK